MRRSILIHESRVCADGWLLWFVFAFGAVVLALALATTAAAGTAYYSLVGNFANAGDQHNFFFDLTRPVGSAEALRFQTFASGGGPNAAGDIIVVTPTGIDSVVQLFDSDVSRGVNDDYDIVNHARDSLLSWPGFTPNPAGANTPLNPDPLPSVTGTYRLNLSEFGNDAPGQWALDLVGPEDAIVFTRDSPTGASTISTLTAGNGAQVSFELSYQLNGGKSFTFQSGADFTVDSYLDIGDGTNGYLTLENAGTSLTTNSSSSADWGRNGGGGGVYLGDNATANIHSWRVDMVGDSDPLSSAFLIVDSGADLTINTLNVATGSGAAQVNVTGSGSTLTQNGGSTLIIGSTSGVLGLLDIRDSAVFTSGTGAITVDPTGNVVVNDATFNANGSLTVASTGVAGANLHGVVLENQGQINSRDVTIGANVSDGSVLINGYTPMIGLPATWNVTGSMSIGSAGFGNGSATVEQTGRLNVSNDLTVAGSSDGPGTLTVQTNGRVTVDDTLLVGAHGTVELLGSEITTRSIIVQPGGTFTHTDGTLTVDGGQFTMEGSALKIDSASGTPIVRLQNGAQGSVPSNAFQSGVIEVGADGHGWLEILSEATVTSGAGWISSGGATFPGAGVGHVLVQGEDSLWQLSGDAGGGGTWSEPLVIGQNGAGTLEIRDGGHVVSAGNAIIGSPHHNLSNAGPGTVIVDGPDSLLRVTPGLFDSGGQLSIGGSSSSTGAGGFLTVSNGGRVEAERGLYVSNAGTVTLSSSGEIIVGAFAVYSGGTFTHDDGTLTVDGGTFDPGVANYTIDGAAAADLPVVKLINGATASISTDFPVIVGVNDRGRLEILSGSQVDLPDAFSVLNIGLSVSSEGEVKVEGPGSQLTTQWGLVVGEGGSGVLRILGGGSVFDPASPYEPIGWLGGSDGFVEVSGTALGGTPSTWTTNGVLRVGSQGYGRMTISAGGRVNALAGATIAEYSSASNSGATVTGFDPISGSSRWDVTGSLYVGGHSGASGGAGTLTVANFGHVTASNVKVWQPGTIELSNGTISTDNLELAGGTLRGSGEVNLPVSGSLHNAGLVSPGLSPGVIIVSSDYVQTAAGTLAIEIGGTSPFEYDQLIIINGSATLGGTLDVSYIDLGSGVFAPSTGNTFEILTAAGGLGGTTFDNIFFPDLGGGLIFGVFYNPTDVTLAVGGVLGDYNLNGFVDAADYTVWRNTLHQSGSGLAADGNNNGSIDVGDYAVWKSHYGQMAGSGSGAAAELPSNADAAIPEPPTLPLLILAAAGWYLRRCRTDRIENRCNPLTRDTRQQWAHSSVGQRSG